jgi:hypothetical protein
MRHSYLLLKQGIVHRAWRIGLKSLALCSLPSYQRFAGLAKPIKIQLMICHLITCGFHYLLGPTRNITKVQLHHVATGFTNDVVMMIL